MKNILVAVLWLLSTSLALAASGTVYVDTGGSATNSGTTDTNSPPAGFSGASVDATNVAGTTVTLPTNTNLTGLSTAGDQAIYWNNATNTNQKIFWISGVTGCTGAGACSVTVAPATTCTTCNAGSWAIGGRYVYPSAGTTDVVVAALRAGDTLLFNNSPASKTAAFVSNPVSGTSAAGFVTIAGKAGVMPTLTVNGGRVVDFGNNLNLVRDLILVRSDSGGASLNFAGTGLMAQNVRVSGGSITLNSTGNNNRVLFSEVTGGTGSAVVFASGNGQIVGSYIHGAGAAGIDIQSGAPAVSILNNVISGNVTRGILFSSGSVASNAVVSVVANNTIYGNGTGGSTTGSGLEVTDADTAISLYNNIFKENGTAAGSYNIKWVAGAAELVGIHYNNVSNHSNCQGTNTGGTGTAAWCASNVTQGSTESSTDPGLINAAGANFGITSTSPAFQTGVPGVINNSSTTGYESMGATIPQNSGGGGRIIGG